MWRWRLFHICPMWLITPSPEVANFVALERFIQIIIDAHFRVHDLFPLWN